jgi:predicted CXXCH cytochrome family protein
MKYNRLNTIHKNLIILLLILLFSALLPVSLSAQVTGTCSNCHTMHNSQDNSAMATYGAAGEPWTGTGPFRMLVRGDCLGCHGIGSNNIVTLGSGNTSDVPQVLHDCGDTDLAGGNFGYIIDFVGCVGSGDSSGHNVVDLGDLDDILHPVGSIPPPGHHSTSNFQSRFTCAGADGCHGNRATSTNSLESLRGAHHNNVDGALDTADEVYNSYRFLRGVKGYENNGASPWQNVDKDNHNEYFGATSPMTDGSQCSNCHSAQGIQPTNNTISGFCGTCHGNFHLYGGHGSDPGIDNGAPLGSPFVRHPTDVVLPPSGEYTAYNPNFVGNEYSVEAPVARTSVPSSIGSTVTPGTDVVMCLSCHYAHASQYPDMLRWDYNDMDTGTTGAAAGSGCFTCHTDKDGS